MFLDTQAMKEFYFTYSQRAEQARNVFKRPLTFAEKILFSHLADSSILSPSLIRGKSFVLLQPDRVAMQDATAQMALLQFLQTKMQKVAVPSTVHCDHLITAYKGALSDVDSAYQVNKEVYEFLESACAKHGIGFWKPGSGIIHQVILENYACPGTMMIGTDSHTPNAGGLSMIAVGVGGSDATDVMAGQPWGLTLPKLIGIKLTGKLNGWTAHKDIILKVAEILTVKGGTGAIIEYFGDGVKTLSCTGKATITNMGAEVGATTSLFPCDEGSYRYLEKTQRKEIAELARKCSKDLQADSEVEQNPEKYFDRIITIDLSTLQPHIVGPHTPDLAREVSKIGDDAKKNNWPVTLSAALIGSCTNSSYEDIGRAASIAKQALAHGMKSKVPFYIAPGSEQVFETIKRDGYIETLEKIGGVVWANACGACIGQWKRDEVSHGQANSIITSFNRNFKERNDGNPATHAFIGSPEIVTAYALSGTFDFNPLTDTLIGSDNKPFRLSPPTADELPKEGYTSKDKGYQAPTFSGVIKVDPKSERLSLIDPFQAIQAYELLNMKILVKALGKCTTDHISPAGKWLTYRGHLDNISNNMFCGAVNSFTKEAGKGKNLLTGQNTIEFSKIARAYKAANIGWVAVGDDNYGEGSSREHAAMEPRHLGCKAVIAKSFARIAETNLKKQGLLPLWLVNTSDYEKFKEDDSVSIEKFSLAVGKNIIITLKHSDGQTDTVETSHTFTEEQIPWFVHGSSLNYFGTLKK